MAQPVIYFETNLQEKGQEILSRARRATTLSLKSPYVRGNLAEISQIIHASLHDNTPVGPDQWHHTGGSLQESTDVVMEEGADDSGGTAQWVISATQDAENPYGTHYAPFVILGHRTRGSASPVSKKRRALNIGWVTENPYPTAAIEEVWPEVQAQLDLMAREIAEETVRYITSGQEGL